MHKIAEIIFGEELEVIPSYIEDCLPENQNKAVWCLGKSIQLMAEADYFIGTYLCGMCYYGCHIELTVANNYNIPMATIDERGACYIMPDLFEANAVKSAELIPTQN